MRQSVYGMQGRYNLCMNRALLNCELLDSVSRNMATLKTDHYWKKLPQNSSTAVMLIWCLKQVKDFILKFSINGSFFSRKQKVFKFINFNTSLVSFR